MATLPMVLDPRGRPPVELQSKGGRPLLDVQFGDGTVMAEVLSNGSGSFDFAGKVVGWYIDADKSLAECTFKVEKRFEGGALVNMIGPSPALVPKLTNASWAQQLEGAKTWTAADFKANTSIIVTLLTMVFATDPIKTKRVTITLIMSR